MAISGSLAAVDTKESGNCRSLDTFLRVAGIVRDKGDAVSL